MWKKNLTMSLVLVIVLSFTTCGEAELPSSQEIVDDIIESFGNIRTYQLDMDMTIDITGEDEGEAYEISFTIVYSGTIDVENRQMRFEMTGETTWNGQPEMEMELEIYIIDNMMYQMTDYDFPEQDPTWVKDEVTEEWWEEWHQSGWGESQIELLEAAQVEVMGTERVDGIDCYVLEVTPDLEQLWQFYNHLTFHEAPDVTEEYLQEIFRSFSVKQWVAKDTYFLAKAEIDIATEESPERAPSDIAIVLLSYNYNQPVSIVLPPEDEETEEEEAPPAEEEGEAEPPEIVTFPDANLEAAIRDELGKTADEEITVTELDTLTTLSAEFRDITDLSGLEYCTSLTVLIIGRNQISDISPLFNLTSLTRLYLEANRISDISPLENLTNLTSLGLDENQISDISPLENLTGLTWLRLSENQISDITPLSNLTSLTELSLSAHQISDITPLGNLTNLEELWLDGNQISDITPLGNLTSLNALLLDGNQISDITPLGNLTSLTDLGLDGNQISDITPLGNLTNLTDLWLDGNQISDISPLSNLTSLTYLGLNGNQISDISPLVANSGLGAGDEVRLEDNNLDLSEGSEDMENIRALEDRGVTVNY